MILLKSVGIKITDLLFVDGGSDWGPFYYFSCFKQKTKEGGTSRKEKGCVGLGGKTVWATKVYRRLTGPKRNIFHRGSVG